MGSRAPNFKPSSPGAVVVGLEALLFGVWALLQAVKKLAKRLMLRVRARGDSNISLHGGKIKDKSRLED
jgi:hypothetical protein